MRVEDPTKFGEVMLRLTMTGQTPNSQQLNAMFGHDENIYKLINRPMVHLTYQTAYVDDAGKLILRDDIYGFDARINAILHSDERRIADVAPPQDPKRDLATAKSQPGNPAPGRAARGEQPVRLLRAAVPLGPGLPSKRLDSWAFKRQRAFPQPFAQPLAVLGAKVPWPGPPHRRRPGHFPPCFLGSSESHGDRR